MKINHFLFSLVLSIAALFIATDSYSQQYGDQPLGSLRIESTPPGANAWLGKMNCRRNTPFTIGNVPVGQHTIKVEMYGYQDYEETVTVYADKCTVLKATLTPKEGFVFPNTQDDADLAERVEEEDPLSDRMNGHEGVDLGLSVMWATCNVGASSPGDFGDYYSWGGTKARRKFTWKNYEYNLKNDAYEDGGLKKYNENTLYGPIDSKVQLEKEDDAARTKWGGGWRMPSVHEQLELWERCTWTWTTMDGIKGYLVTSKINNNSIFLPAAGYRKDGKVESEGEAVWYWSSSLYPKYDSYKAWALSLKAGDLNESLSLADDDFKGHTWRYRGLPVRAVIAFGDPHHDLQSAAVKGDVKAQYDLGYANFEEKNYKEAVYWIQKAADKGYAAAQSQLGYCYEHALGVKQDYTKAVKLYYKAAQQGLGAAQNNLAYCYQVGHGVEQDYAKAEKWYRKALENGTTVAQGNLDRLLLAKKEMEDKVPADEQFKLGIVHFDNEEYAEAFRWFLKAAEKGHAEAQTAVATCYAGGMGVKRSGSEALKWFRKAAEQGESESEYMLGKLYLEGAGVPKNESEGIKWITRSAEHGYLVAQLYFVAKYYPKGKYEEAYKWVKMAAEAGEAECQYILSKYYSRGLGGVKEDKEKAIKLVRQAAENGSSNAQFVLADCYRRGIGVGISFSLDEARKWYTKAANQGNKEAKEMLDRLNEKAVDMGLSVKWASRNLGASGPEDSGDYHFFDKKTAKSDLGSKWRLPTVKEWQELMNKCEWRWVTSANGVKGYVVYSRKTNNVIFLPAAGYISIPDEYDGEMYMSLLNSPPQKVSGVYLENEKGAYMSSDSRFFCFDGDVDLKLFCEETKMGEREITQKLESGKGHDLYALLKAYLFKTVRPVYVD